MGKPGKIDWFLLGAALVCLLMVVASLTGLANRIASWVGQ